MRPWTWPEQRQARGWKGAIVTNPNCAAVVLVMALAPLRQVGVRRVSVTTMQAVSGAGYPGVASLDILGNLVPYIGGGEEEKIETESLKMLGSADSPYQGPAHVNRIPVLGPWAPPRVGSLSDSRRRSSGGA